MTQNRSTAVMQRRNPAPDALDYYPTPPFATRALCEFLAGQGEPLGAQSCWEPACGEMHMAAPLVEYFAEVRATDVHRYSPEHGICDFLFDGRSYDPVSWVITNPPFLVASQFIETAIGVAKRGAAMLVRTAFTEGDERYRSLFSRMPPAYVLQFVERVPMLRGRLIQSGAPDPFNVKDGEPQKAGSATAYCWLVWIHGQTDTRFRWLPKCRERLERAGDYPGYPEAWATVSGGDERQGAML